MKKKASFFYRIASATFILITLLAASSEAHPWGGLVIDSNGDLYFTFICPFVDDDHYACVWKIESNQELSEVLKSQRSPSDIILARSPDRMIFAAERSGFNPNFNNTLWKIQDSKATILIGPNTNQDTFFIQTYAISNDGTIYFAKEDRIYKRDYTGSLTELELEKDIGRVQLIEIGDDGELYIMANGDLYIKNDDSLTLLISGLKAENPENLPFRGANIFFDMAIDNDKNVYLAYYGNREVIKISANGDTKTILESQAPWSPHGVDVINGEVYVLESTLGNGKWWKLWEKTEIIPRVRKIDKSGKVSEIFRYAID